MPKKVKYALIIIVSIIALIVIIGLVATLSRSNKVTVEIITVPSDAKLTINGEPATQGKHEFEKGVYTLEGKREFFGTVTQELDTSTVNPDQPFYLVLDVSTPEAEQYFIDHPEEGFLLDAAGSQEYNNHQQKILNNYPNITQLPYNNANYQISYEVVEDANVVFIVNMYPPNALQPGSNLYNNFIEETKNAARLKLGEIMEIDPESANITFKAYNTPL